MKMTNKYGYHLENLDEFRKMMSHLFGHLPTNDEIVAVVGRLSKEDQAKIKALLV